MILKKRTLKHFYKVLILLTWYKLLLVPAAACPIYFSKLFSRVWFVAKLTARKIIRIAYFEVVKSPSLGIILLDVSRKSRWQFRFRVACPLTRPRHNFRAPQIISGSMFYFPVPSWNVEVSATPKSPPSSFIRTSFFTSGKLTLRRFSSRKHGVGMRNVRSTISVCVSWCGQRCQRWWRTLPAKNA